jgi:hypothetical protein
MIAVECNCGKRYAVGEQHAGKRLRCKTCSKILNIPSAPEHDALCSLPEPTTETALVIKDEPENLESLKATKREEPRQESIPVDQKNGPLNTLMGTKLLRAPIAGQRRRARDLAIGPTHSKRNPVIIIGIAITVIGLVTIWLYYAYYIKSGTRLASSPDINDVSIEGKMHAAVPWNMVNNEVPSLAHAKIELTTDNGKDYELHVTSDTKLFGLTRTDHKIAYILGKRYRARGRVSGDILETSSLELLQQDTKSASDKGLSGNKRST